jgi:hypothetical protein
MTSGIESNLVIEEKVVFTVKDIKNLLNIGIDQAYDLVNSGQFPVKHIGKKKVIPIKPFMDWLNS